MAYQGIGTGTTPNDNSGDSLLVGAVKVNSNFQEVYNALGDGTNIVLTKNRSINAGAGLTGGGNLNSDRTLSVLTGSGVTISQGLVGVDTSVIRTTGNQTIVGVLTATSFVKSGGTSSGFLKADGSVDNNAYITVASVPGAANDGQLTLQTSGVGLSGNQTFTANQSGNVTFTITSNATPSGTTPGTIVSRGSNGDFSAGSITATSFVKSGGTSSGFLKADGSVDTNAYITVASVPAAPNNGQLTLQTSGVGLSGSQTFTANQSGNATFTITSNATSSNTASTLVARDSSGNFSAGSITATSFNGQQVNATSGSIAILNGTNLNYSGISTFSGSLLGNQASFAGIVTASGSLLGNQASFAGVVTASSFVKSGGTSSGFLKADGSVDSNTYLTSLGNGVIPIGGIIMWSGSIATIPTGWALCNGSNGTPNLTDRFVLGAGNSYPVNNTGGSTSVSGTTNGTALTRNQIPPHRHGINHEHLINDPGHKHIGFETQGGGFIPYVTTEHNTGQGGRGGETANSAPDAYQTTSATTGITVGIVTNSSISTPTVQLGGLGNGRSIVNGQNVFNDLGESSDSTNASPHTHPVSINHMPPYYALAFIMRVS